jgi:cytochrome P450
MPFRLADWRRLLARLGLARMQVAQFRAATAEERETLRHLLDSAILSLHAMAEYAVNVVLELAGNPPERRHRTGDRARELRLTGRLRGDYQQILDQLQTYRLAAQYLGYGRRPSVHYNATNVETCLSQIDQLVEETAAALRASGQVLE